MGLRYISTIFHLVKKIEQHNCLYIIEKEGTGDKVCKISRYQTIVPGEKHLTDIYFMSFDKCCEKFQIQKEDLDRKD